MATKPVSISLLQPKTRSEDAYFAERDRKLIQKLRDEAKKDTSDKYCEEHKYHCFRCGTASLAEVVEGSVKIDICVNEGCGAVHLDPGELKEIIENQGSLSTLSATRKAFLSIFK